MVTLMLAAAVLGTQASAASDSLVIEVFDHTAEVSFVTDRDDAMRAFVRTGTRFAAAVPAGMAVRVLVDSGVDAGRVFALQELLVRAGLSEVTVTASARDRL